MNINKSIDKRIFVCEKCREIQDWHNTRITIKLVTSLSRSRKILIFPLSSQEYTNISFKVFTNCHFPTSPYNLFILCLIRTTKRTTYYKPHVHYLQIQIVCNRKYYSFFFFFALYLAHLGTSTQMIPPLLPDGDCRRVQERMHNERRAKFKESVVFNKNPIRRWMQFKNLKHKLNSFDTDIVISISTLLALTRDLIK